jgi:tripartite-type tricarboxylate transporter receptor subunit TctC
MNARYLFKNLKLLWAVFVIASAIPSSAQLYPSKPIRLVVGFAPGGGTDTIARILASKLSEGLGHAVIIDNRPGANSNIGTEYVAKSIADGYTLLFNTNAIAINMSLYKNIRYDALKDFSAINMIASSPLMLVVHPSLPTKTTNELIKLARSKPGQLNYSSSGGPQHLATELFKIKTKTNIIHVPFSGSAPAMTALISGEVQMTISNLPTLLPHVTLGRLRPLGVVSGKRTMFMPDVPTMKEAGIDMDVAVWYGLFAPAATPQGITARLSDSSIVASRSADVQEKILKLGAETVGMPALAFSKQLAQEVLQWADVVKAAGVKPD